MPETATSNTLNAATLKPAALKPLARLRAGVRNAPPKLVIGVLLAATIAAVAFFLFSDLKGNVSYVLPRRALKVAAMLLVAVAVGVSTLLFQTVTANRILTPSIMGFDSLYILVQTTLVFTVSAAAASPRSSGPTAPASPRCCRSSAGSSRWKAEP
jgi:iron complex transport system permease protein